MAELTTDDGSPASPEAIAEFEHRDKPPWGSKITISIYVEGDTSPATSILLAEAAASEYEDTYGERPYFVGAKVEPVEDRPIQQGEAAERIEGAS